MNKFKAQLHSAAFYISALFFAILFAGYRFTNIMDDWIGFAKHISHDYHRPFVTRALIPWAGGLLHRIGFSPELSFQGLEILGTFLLIILFSIYLNLFLEHRSLSRILSFSLFLILPFYLILPRLINLWYPWDIWASVFNVLLLILMFQKRWWAYYLTFIIATINRETTCFMTIAMLIIFWGRLPFWKLALHLASQFVIWMGLKTILEHIFSGTSGGLFEHNFWSNLAFVKNLFTCGGVSNGSCGKSGFHAITYGLALSYMLLVFVVAAYWKRLSHPFLKRAFLVLVPYYGIVFVIGNTFEYRLLAEMIPLALAPALVLLTHVIIAGPSNDSRREQSERAA